MIREEDNGIEQDKDIEITEAETEEFENSVDSIRDSSGSYVLSGMYRNWFLSYASYVILERAVPHIKDGLKPVQRRIPVHDVADGAAPDKVADIVGRSEWRCTHVAMRALGMPWYSWGRRTC